MPNSYRLNLGKDSYKNERNAPTLIFENLEPVDHLNILKVV